MTTDIIGPVQPQALVEVPVFTGFSIRISDASRRLVREVKVNERTGMARFAFMPIKSKTQPDVCGALGIGQGAAKTAVKRARREVGVAWVAMAGAYVGTGKLLFRGGTLSKSGGMGLSFDAGDGDDAALVAELESAKDEVEALKAKLAALEAPKA